MQIKKCVIYILKIKLIRNYLYIFALRIVAKNLWQLYLQQENL